MKALTRLDCLLREARCKMPSLRGGYKREQRGKVSKCFLIQLSSSPYFSLIDLSVKVLSLQKF